jgi:cytochrome c-type biogenesis protein CcmF
MIEYIGEHPFYGQLGNTLVILSFVAALMAAASYVLAHYQKSDVLRITGRWFFRVHSVALIGAAGTLFFMLFNKFFEYDYVWKHANEEMPLRYIFSCFWEGQEGSFLLWSFWHVLLGNVFLHTARRWENLGMAVVAGMQALLGSMILGIFIFDFQVGNSAFSLIRELPENLGAPWTTMPNYLESVPSFAKGRGLNPLLQNYWMTIHPPTLFLGYASTVIPFAFAIAGLWSGQLKEWVRPAIPWAFFSVSILGIGILMGGAWAYEALSFGGFWAWDPVENASLIPWITIVGAAHVMVVNQRKNRSLYTAIFLTITTYVMVMYASFLVHSGVLGDSSVHSFTDNGLMRQHLFILLSIILGSTLLIIFDKRLKMIFLLASAVLIAFGVISGEAVAAMVAFFGMAIVLMIVSYRKVFPKPAEEEPLWSREFWMFIGALVLLLAAAQITLETSKPIWNILAQPFAGPLMDLHKLTGIDGLKSLAEGKLAPHSDVISHFNKWQVPFAFIVTFLIACTQFMRYGKNQFGVFARKIALAFVVASSVAVVAGMALGYTGDEVPLLILLFTTLFAVFANLDYVFRVLKGKFDFAGASVAHIGFALVMLGALISTSRSEKISENASRFDIERLNDDFKNNEDILLFKNDTVQMGPYFVSYEDKYREGVNLYYKVHYYDSKARSYKAGDMVIARGAIFSANEDHAPGPDFIVDQNRWTLMEDPRGVDLDAVERWSQFKPGNFLFTLNPRIQMNPEFGNVAEPATKRYLDRDIYTHVRWAELEPDSNEAGFRSPDTLKLAVGDTAFVGSTMVRLNGLSVIKPEQREEYMVGTNDLAVRAMIGIRDDRGEVYEAEPLYILRDSVMYIPDPVIQDETGLQLSFIKIDPITGEHEFSIAEHYSRRKEFIVLQAIAFPWINILWIGCIVMFIGTLMAVRHRIRQSKKIKTE